jgi:signal transduction histidine kinase
MEATKQKEMLGTILVIDDERGPRESLRMLFKYDYEVFTADGVDEGIQQLRQKRPDLIIMDLRMPEKNGIEGLQEIRQIDSTVSVVMLTGYGDLDTAQKAIRLGANDYLQKPFDTNEIREVIKKYVDRSKRLSRKKQAQDELQRMTKSLGREVGKTNKLTTLGAASSELVRDLRNPLTIIRGYLDLLSYELKEKSSGDTKCMEEYIDQIEKNVDRCAELVESWKSLGRFDFSSLQRINLVNTLNDCFRDVGRSDIAFSLKVEGIEEQYEILGERLQVKRAFQNLINNAVHAIEGTISPEIRISCSMDKANIFVRIEDRGCGVDTRTLRWVFEPMEYAAPIKKGVGLGLFITKKVIEDHRGQLTLESRLGEGTTVTVVLPQSHTALGYYSNPNNVTIG